MKVRTRWFSVAPRGIALRALAAQMQLREYNRRCAVGFQLEEVRKKYVKGTFVERMEWDDTVVDPAGGTFQVHRVDVRQVRFRFCSENPEIEIVDPPRSLSKFVESISECVGSDVRLSEVSLALEDWLPQLEKRLGKVVVNAVTTTSMPVSASTTATVAIAGSEDVRKYLARFTVGTRVRAERLVVTFPAPHRGRVELLLGGRAAVVDGDFETMQTLRESLQAALITT